MAVEFLSREILVTKRVAKVELNLPEAAVLG
jgi:hypothetical protein